MVLSHDEAASHQASISTGPVIGSPFAIDLPYFRILALETQDFIRRDVLGTQIERALVDPRTSVTSLIGIGGSGKTTLATWAALRAYENKRFNFIVSLTAKDRELGTMGIQSLSTGPTTFEVLLNTVLEVLGFTELAEALSTNGRPTFGVCLKVRMASSTWTTSRRSMTPESSPFSTTYRWESARSSPLGERPCASRCDRSMSDLFRLRTRPRAVFASRSGHWLCRRPF